jgi:MYXO-CTERM domain-containing protein
MRLLAQLCHAPAREKGTVMRLNPTRLKTWVTAAALLGIVAAPSEAAACGGFFCSRSPVDQTAEHIIFTVNADHTVTAYVQIQYQGDKDDFAWIVPVPGVPQLSADFPNLAMTGLDNATQPVYSQGLGCFPPPPSAAGVGGKSGGPTDTGVTVLAKQSVGPFDTVTLEGTSADVLVTWLNDNGYRVTDKMIPLIQPYVEGGLHLVALKLQADKQVTDIKPLVMKYESDKPMIPLRLTGVAAQPEMGIVAFILSNRRWAPENYVDLKIPDSLIEFGPYGYPNNYLKVVSAEADKVGGQAFVTEYAKSTQDLLMQVTNQSVNPSIPDAQKAKDSLMALFEAFPYITRLYTRMSAEEMIDDPLFMPASANEDVSNIHDLSDPNFDRSKCPSTQPPAVPPCTFVYCGRRGVCVNSNGVAACVCASDATARLTNTGPAGGAVYCEPVKQDLSGSPGDGGLVFAPACEGFDCGPHGACVPMNGNPTCQCEAGYGAITKITPDPAGTAPATTQVYCQAVSEPVPSMPVLPPPGQTELPKSDKGAGGASSGPSSSGGSSSSSTPGGVNAAGSGGSSSTNRAMSPGPAGSDSGCSVSTRTPDGTAGVVLAGLVAAAFARSRRRRSA